MKRNFLLGVVLPFMLLVNSSGVHCIVGGGVAGVGVVGHQVAINLQNNVFCSGTIVNQNHVVTACRCVLNPQQHLIPFNTVTIRAGITDLLPNAATLAIIAIFPHPNYNALTNENNIAVLRTQNNFVFQPNVAAAPISQVALAEHVTPDGSTCRVAGWVNPTAAVPNSPLHMLDVQVHNRDTVCNTVLVRRMFEEMLCAGPLAANVGVCPINQGAGLVCNNLLVGVLTDSFGCGVANSPGVYTQVRMHRVWITQQFTRTEIPPPGPTPAPVAATTARPPTGSPADKIVSSICLMIASALIGVYNH